MRLPRSVERAEVEGKAVLVRADLNVPLEGGGSPTTPASGRRCRRSGCCSNAAPTRCASARTSVGRRGRIRPSGSRPSRTACRACSVATTVSACSRTRASTPARPRTTRASRASSPRAATSTSTTPSARRTARTARPRPSRICFPPTRVCSYSTSSRISEGCSATSSGPSSWSPAARRSRTSWACSGTWAAAPTPCSSAARWRRSSATRTHSASTSSCRPTWSRRPRSTSTPSHA